jgi:hypothetical protein
MSDAAKKRASRLRELKDAHQELQETGSEAARKRRHLATLKGSPEDNARAGDFLAGEAWQEGSYRKDRLKALKFTGWKRKTGE